MPSINHKNKKMKKNLRNILVLSLGLMSTVSFAQDWDVDSRTRVNMHGDNDMMLTEQRATLGVTWEGSDWGIHVSSDVNYGFGDLSEGTLTAKVYEANASVNLMDYANMTAGRQALNFGSGMILSDNQFTSGTRNTWDGLRFDVTAIEMADISLGYASANTGDPSTLTGLNGNKGTQMFINANKSDGDWSANFLYVSQTGEVGSSDGTDGSEGTWTEYSNMNMMGLDVDYAMMGGDLMLGGAYNTMTIKSYVDGVEDFNGTMYSLGATYSVSEEMTISGNQTSYGKEAFSSSAGNRAGGFMNTGNLGYLNANDQDRNVSATYTMGDLSLSGTYHMITNTGEDEGESTTNADYERNVMDISLGYAMSDNASLSLKYATDEVGDADADKMMWVTLNVRP